MQITKSLSRVLKYTVVRGTTIFMTVVVGVYLTIIVANLGGYVDEIFRGQIALQIMGMVQGGWLDDVPLEERDQVIEETTWQMEEARGLHQPFLLRSARWLVNGLTLNLGEASLRYFFKGILVGAERAVQVMVLERLPYTLLLVGAANVLVFIASVTVALVLSRKYGGVMDRLMVGLSSFTSAPSWIFGVVLIVILAGRMRILPFPKAIDLQYAEFTPEYVRLILTQMIMPVMAIFLSVFFLGAYTWRTFFLMYSREDYVEVGKAKGLSPRVLEQRYILRPSLPFVITSFALMIITVWEGAIALEILFNWPGVGPLFLQGITNFNTPIIVAVVVVFAYMLAITVFLLDIFYAVVDPRIRVGSSGQSMRPARRKRKWRFTWSRKNRREQDQLQAQTFQANSNSQPAHPRLSFSQRIKRTIKRIGSPLRELTRYPSAILGLVIIATLIGVSVYTIFAIPVDEAISLWKPHGSEEGRSRWYQNSRNAMPAWVNLFRREKLPETIVLSSKDGSANKNSEAINEDMTAITFA